MAVITTKAIVLSTIKYGDTSLIVKCFTEVEGIKTYLIKGLFKSKRGAIKVAHFQPLTQLQIVANHNTKGNLNNIKEVRVLHHYKSLYTHIIKQSIVLFISEILTTTIKEEERNRDLYQYLETNFIWLDTHHSVANFHLFFLLNLTRFLGFYPDTSNQHLEGFHLLEGKFTFSTHQKEIIKNEKLIQFKKLLGIQFDAIEKVSFNKQERQQVLQIIIQYFKLHLEGFKNPKSLSILETVFS